MFFSTPNHGISLLIFKLPPLAGGSTENRMCFVVFTVTCCSLTHMTSSSKRCNLGQPMPCKLACAENQITVVRQL